MALKTGSHLKAAFLTDITTSVVETVRNTGTAASSEFSKLSGLALDA